jgi:hypothetical protein
MVRLAVPLVAALVLGGAVLCGTVLCGTAAGALSARTPAQERMARIVLQWSARLNAKDNDGLARLFAVPALIVQGPYAYRLVNRTQIARWYSLLPCAGHLTRIVFSGRYATAVFRLGNRGATRCDAPGGLAAARFEIVNDKIVSWVQVAVPTNAAAAPVA